MIAALLVYFLVGFLVVEFAIWTSGCGKGVEGSTGSFLVTLLLIWLVWPIFVMAVVFNTIKKEWE